MSSVPTQHKEIVYWTGIDHTLIESMGKLSPVGLAAKGYSPLAQVWMVSLRKGDLHWSGYIEAPPYDLVRSPVTQIEDLINNTHDCPTCHGSGKVPND